MKTSKVLAIAGIIFSAMSIPVIVSVALGGGSPAAWPALVQLLGCAAACFWGSKKWRELE